MHTVILNYTHKLSWDLLNPRLIALSLDVCTICCQNVMNTSMVTMLTMFLNTSAQYYVQELHELKNMVILHTSRTVFGCKGYTLCKNFQCKLEL